MKIATDLPWEEFAVVPESYATTWSCLYGNLQVEKGQTLLFRGATPALGQAALNIAASTGLNVIAAPRNQASFEKLLGLGPKRAELEGPRLSKRLPEARKAGVPSILSAIIRFSIRLRFLIATDASALLAGWTRPIPEFNPLLQMASGVHFSFVFDTPEFSVSEVRFREIVGCIGKGIYKTKPAAALSFDEIRKAQRLMGSNQATGKILVKL
jgi:NADPH:quinone reductase-like Zn-dependent oxidoreductase